MSGLNLWDAAGFLAIFVFAIIGVATVTNLAIDAAEQWVRNKIGIPRQE